MAQLTPGTQAPGFSVPDETGTLRTLEEFRGKRLVLWFYPKADTPGWKVEGNGFRDRARHFEELGDVVVLGASFDSPEDNRRFREKHDYPFSLLCDTERELAVAYGAAKDASASHPDRITVVVGKDGTVERVYDSVNPFEHADQVLRDLGGTPPESGGLISRLTRGARQLFGK